MKLKLNRLARKSCILKNAALFCLVLTLSALMISCSHDPRGDIAIIDVEGLIEPTSAKKVLKNIEKVRDNKWVKAVIIRIDSPGGAVAASQEIYESIKSLDKEKPVIVSMGTLAASGGYYVAIGGRKIFANAGTITGSIGVRFDHYYAGKLMEKIGVGNEILKTGKLKNLSPIDRPMNPEEKKFMMSVLDELRTQFIMAIASERKIPKEEIDIIADGRIFTGNKAKELKLIDDIGGLQVAIEEAGKIAGIEGKPKTFRIRPKKSFVRMLFEEAESIVNVLESFVPLYIWG